MPNSRIARGSLMGSKLGISLTAYIVDSFAEAPFQGNPAAVCLVQGVQDVPDATKQALADEFNLSETAFVSPLNLDDKFSQATEFNLRWFTPSMEVKLCGHATLAAASIIFSECGNTNEVLNFKTLSGDLFVRRSGDKYVLDFPQNKPTRQWTPDPELQSLVSEVLGDLTAQEVFYEAEHRVLLIRAEDFVSRSMLEDLRPSGDKLLALHDGSKVAGIIVTVSGKDGYDFFSRFFGPWTGPAEDPVTGMAHTILGPYWSEQLNFKHELVACQCSRRSGDLYLNVREDNRIEISGSAVTVLKGEVNV